MAKISILLFVLRLQDNRTVAYLIWAVMSVMSIVNIVTVAMLAAQCQPLAKLWDHILPGTCSPKSNISKIGYGQGVVNVLTDFFCTTTPIVVVWNVQISKRVKVVICGLMSLGLVATASQIVRVVTLPSLQEDDYSCTCSEFSSIDMPSILT